VHTPLPFLLLNESKSASLSNTTFPFEKASTRLSGPAGCGFLRSLFNLVAAVSVCLRLAVSCLHPEPRADREAGEHGEDGDDRLNLSGRTSGSS